MSRRGIVRGGIVLFSLLVLLCWASGELRYEVDELTSASRQTIRFGPFTWNCAETRSPIVTWAESTMDDPTCRSWAFSGSEPIPPFQGLCGSRASFRAASYLWRSDLSDRRKVELLREWQAIVMNSPDRASRRAAEEDWIERNRDEIGLVR